MTVLEMEHILSHTPLARTPSRGHDHQWRVRQVESSAREEKEVGTENPSQTEADLFQIMEINIAGGISMISLEAF